MHKKHPRKKVFSAIKERRAASVLGVLKKTYSHATIALQFNSPIHLLVAVILSAQCTDKKVNEVTRALFKKYKTVNDFANADTKTFEQEIRPTGFYRAKTKSVITTAKMLRDEYNGKIPHTMKDILKLRGVARKTANVVLGNAYGIVEGIAVDTHVKRLAGRLGFSTSQDPVKIERDLMALFHKKDWFKLTYMLIDHGRAICKAPTPKCEMCPVIKLCPTGRGRLGRSPLPKE